MFKILRTKNKITLINILRFTLQNCICCHVISHPKEEFISDLVKEPKSA